MADLATKITIQVDAKGAESSLSQLAAEYKKLTDEFKKPLAQIDAFANLKKSLNDSKKALEEARAKVAELAKEMNIAGQHTKELSTAFEKAKASAGALKDKVAEQQAALQGMRNAMSAAGIDVTKLASEQVRLKNSLQQATASLQQNAAVTQAFRTLGVRSFQDVEREIANIKQAYQTLSQAGTVSFAELNQAHASATARIAALRKETAVGITSISASAAAVGTSAKQIGGLTSLITSGYQTGKTAVLAFNEAVGNGRHVVEQVGVSVKGMIGAYVGITAAQQALRGVVEILQEADKANLSMKASVAAASREFANTGSLTYWGKAVKQLSNDLQVYSETSLKAAISRTVDMTKRFGLSADQMQELIKRTADLSAGKTTLEQGVERVTAAMRGEAEASEYLGLTLNENYVIAWYNAHTAHETAWKDLTEVQKALVRYQVFLEQTEEMQGRAAESAKTFDGALKLVYKAISDAVTNNRDLAESLSQVAGFIRDNADAIGEMASGLIQTIATVTKFAIEWRYVIAALTTAYATMRTVTMVTTGLSAALLAIQGTGVATAFTGIATAARTATLAGVALSSWMGAGLILAATYAAAKILGLVDAFIELEKAEELANEASKERSRIEDQANTKAQELGERLGLNITSLSHFNKLVQSGRVVWDAQTESWKAATQALNKQTGQVELTEEAMKKLEGAVKAIGPAYDHIRSQVTNFYDFSAQKTKVLSGNVKDAATAEVGIYREKMQAILALAQQEANDKQRIVGSSSASEQQQADLIKQIHTKLKDDKIKALEDYRGKLQSLLFQALNDEQKYAAEVEKLHKALNDARTTFADSIRELNRKTMTEEQAWQDKKKEALEKERAAQEALAKATAETDPAKQAEGYQEAIDLAKKAQEQAKSLAVEVKNGEQTVITIQKGVNEATKIMTTAEQTIEQAIQKQTELAQKNQQEAKDRADAFQKEIDTLTAKIKEVNETPIEPEVTFKVDSQEVDDKIRELRKDTYSTHHINVVTSGGGGSSSSSSSSYKYGDSDTYEGSAAEKYWREYYGFRLGGLIPAVRRFAEGGWNRMRGALGGWGGGDRIRALLEAGEFVIRKEAVAKYGAGFFELLNNMKLNLPSVVEAIATPPQVPRHAYAEGGPVIAAASGPGASETITWRWQLNDKEYPLTLSGPRGTATLMRELEKELGRAGLTRSRT